MANHLNSKDTESSSNSAEDLVRLVQVQVAEVLAFAATMGRRMGLGHSEMGALEHLQHAEAGLTPTELGGRLGLSSGAVTALVDRLERAGYAERRPNPNDRRSSVVRLRPAELGEATRHMRPVREDLVEASSGFTEEERALVGRYVGTITEVFRRARE